ncbi:scarecrow-like protein 21 [Abrus precatorius]|uniref:Scarecrow-like protein 21 n=1 Tax=Abrus precatorius TaxID=3816 RepID=A0A8B8LIB3_ABRPR|nr:scarecrow-like protein 21 [Abrus precatorius]
MDSNQFFRVTSSAGIPYTSSYLPISPIPNRFLGSSKLDIGNSPNSSLFTHFDSETISSALSDSQEQHSSGEIHSGSNPSCNSFQDSKHFLQDSVHLSARSFLGHDASYAHENRHSFLELETVLMAPDGDDQVTTSNTSGQRNRFCSHECQSSEVAYVEKHHKSMEEASIERFPSSNLKQLLIVCAKALSDNNMKDFAQLIEKGKSVVSITGEPIQRLGAYLVEGLVARKEASGNNIYRALRCGEPEGKDLLSYMQMLYEICPYLKFGYMAANGAIAEACRDEDFIHIIDFQIGQGIQWMTLLQALAARPGGAPHVRITGIDDPVSKYARGGGLEAVGKRLAVISQTYNIPVEFHGVPVLAPNVTRNMLDIRPGEALAVNFPLQLHHTADESVDVSNPRDGLLRLVKSLSPKVTTLVEQESNTNTTPFFNRFVETLDYYLAIFESIDVSLSRKTKERINVEQHCLARDIVNIIACEGKERVERHELLGKWKSRLTMAGFRQYPLSSYVNSVIRSLLRCYSEHYNLVEKDGAMLLGWKNRNLISASAWY